MRNHTCLLDHHQRSYFDTIIIGLKGKFNWVLQLVNSHTVKLFDSHKENFNTHNLFENTRVEQTHDGSGQPDERNSSSAHTVKEQFAPEDNRGIALFNTDNEFNRSINEEDIDFNIPGLPHSAVKQLHGASVRELVQKIENHPHRHALQRDLQQRQQFNPFSQESKDMIREVGNIELCELLDTELQSTVQSMSIILGRRHRLLHVRALLAQRNGGEQEICPVHHGSPLDSHKLHEETATPRAPLRKEARGSRVLHREFAQEEMQEEKFLGYSRPVHPRREVPQEHV